MRDPKALALFQEILKKTEAGKVSWQPTAETDKFVALMLGKYTLTIFPHSRLSLPDSPPSVAVDDEKENTIAEINDTIEGITEGDLRSLLVFARRIALRADEKIDELLQELQKPETLIINDARYGARDKWVDVAPRLRAKIRSDQLNLRVTNEELGGDPFLGVVKALEIHYSYQGQSHALIVPENGTLSIP